MVGGGGVVGSCVCEEKDDIVKKKGRERESER